MNREDIALAFRITASVAAGLYAYLFLTTPKDKKV